MLILSDSCALAELGVAAPELFGDPSSVTSALALAQSFSSL